MILSNFLKDVGNLELEQGKDQLENISVEGVSLPDSPKSSTLVLVSSLSFLNRLKESLSNKKFKELGLIISKNLFDSEIDQLKKIGLKLSWVAVTPLFEKTLCDVSKFFYEKKFGEVQHLVDGRKLGTISIHPSAEIAENVFIGDGVKIEEGVKIHPGCVIQSHCSIGKGTTLFPNVSLYPYSVVGKFCRVHSGTVIGADGFGYNFIQGKHEKIWQSGGVEIGDNVEIGSNCSIDCGTFEATKIGDGCRIDNLVQIAHNVTLGEQVVLCGTAGIAGSATLGSYTVVGGRASVAPGVTLGQACQVAGGAGVTKNWPDKSTIAGFPAVTMKEWKKGVIQISRLSRS